MKILIIGAGPGGYQTALAARKKGFGVTVVESGHIGGTCLNAGCIPTKAYCRAAGIYETVLQAESFGVNVAGTDLDFARVKARKDGIVSSLRANVENMLAAAGAELVRGRAKIRDSHTVTVGNTEYHADYIIIATGSVPSMPPIKGSALEGVLDSTSLLDLDTLPQRLCIIGGGVIGLEFASVFNSFGTKVTVVEFCREVLPRFDSDIARRLRQSLSRSGITFFLQSQVESVAGVSDPDTGKKCLEVSWIRKGTRESCVADKVLVATGRRPETAGLDPVAAGIVTERGTIVTDENMRTSIPNIFAIGDVNGRQLLAHAAVAQGRIALEAIISDISGKNPRSGINLSVMPSAVFTSPEAASVGQTEDDCKTGHVEYKAYKSFFRANGKAVCLGETEGMCKILAAPDGRIIGCHICGPHSADLVQEVSVLMAAGGNVADLRNAVHIHPTLSEILPETADLFPE